MLTSTLFTTVMGAGKRRTDPFQAESGGAYATRPIDPTWLVVLIVIYLGLLLLAAMLTRGCKDKGLNFAVVLIDPIAYILARVVFGTC